MSTAFTNALRPLENDRTKWWPLGGIFLILIAWVTWAALAKINLYAASREARLEADGAVYPVQSPRSGRIVLADLAVGRTVKPGDVIVELDSSQERLELNVERTRLEAIQPQITAVRLQIAAERAVVEEEQRTSTVAVDEARADSRQADVPAEYSAVEEKRLQELFASGVIADRDYQRGRAEAQQRLYEAQRQRIAIRRIEQEQRTREGDRQTRILSLQSEIVRLEGLALVSRASVSRLENEIERRVIRAPVGGRLGEADPLRIGSVLSEGDHIGTIVPLALLQIVAQFPPVDAMGRIAPGQRGTVRLEGFPWTQYGTLTAVVSGVATEVRDGTVRVELKIQGSVPPHVPLQHGLPCSVEIATETVTPAALLMRIVGKRLAASNETRL